jgi:hypothetical protein
MPMDAPCCMNAERRYTEELNEKLRLICSILKTSDLGNETLMRLIKEVDVIFADLLLSK